MPLGSPFGQYHYTLSSGVHLPPSSDNVHNTQVRHRSFLKRTTKALCVVPPCAADAAQVRSRFVLCARTYSAAGCLMGPHDLLPRLAPRATGMRHRQRTQANAHASSHRQTSQYPFEGVQGDKSKQGEVFGIKSIFRPASLYHCSFLTRPDAVVTMTSPLGAQRCTTRNCVI